MYDYESAEGPESVPVGYDPACDADLLDRVRLRVVLSIGVAVLRIAFLLCLLAVSFDPAVRLHVAFVRRNREVRHRQQDATLCKKKLRVDFRRAQVTLDAASV